VRTRNASEDALDRLPGSPLVPRPRACPLFRHRPTVSLVLVGGQAERARVDLLIEEARHGRSGTLVILGEPGSEDVAAALRRCGGSDDVVRTQGVPAEAALAFAALHDICRPLFTNVGHAARAEVKALRAASVLSPLRC
jgi:hypothetical protein